MDKQFLDKDGLEIVRDKVNEARETAAGAMALAQQAIDNPPQDIYSSNEVKTNKVWMNGKLIYRKVMDCGPLPNNATATFAHDISNVEVFTSITGIATRLDGHAIPLPSTAPQVSVYADRSDFSVTTTENLNAFQYHRIILEYTKTTD